MNSIIKTPLSTKDFRGLQNPYRPSSQLVLGQLNRLIKHDQWFISGSFAHPKIKFPKDIDVFFYSEEDYLRAITNIQIDKIKFHIEESKYATNVYIPTISETIQLINKHYGTIEEVFDTFDLNVCKYAITPRGQKVQNYKAPLPIEACQVNTETFNRFFKYGQILCKPNVLITQGMKLIDNFLEDSTICEDYYDGVVHKTPVNALLYNTIKNKNGTLTHSYALLHKYLFEQAKIRAPELLI